MSLLLILLTIVGLSIFEIITSIDNAVINAEVLSSMGEKAKRWFVTWGIFFAVFVTRGLLPWLIVWLAFPNSGFLGVFTASFSNDPKIISAIEESSKILLMGGGIFLLFIFLSWLFLEPKNYGLYGERFFHSQGAWFYSIVSIILATVVYLSFQKHPMLALSAICGSTLFFITHGFKQYAEQQEEKLVQKKGLSDISKILYLEVIDASFSIDGVVGAFAFTLAIPVIFLGNGVGALILRNLTIRNISKIKKYKYLKNGAMYSILVLGLIMLFDAFGAKIPRWLSPISTVAIIVYFYNKSRVDLSDLVAGKN